MSIIEVIKSILRSKPSVSPDNFSVRDLLLQITLEDALQHLEGREGLTVSVTDLTSCSQKYHFRLKYPELLITQSYYPALINGRVMHRGIQEILLDRFFDFIQVEVPVEKSLNIPGSDGMPRIVKVSGRVDALLADDTVIEFKTSRSDHETPLEHHVLQLRIYLNMTGRRRGLLVYLTPERITEYWITNPLSDEELQQLVRETLNNERHPRWSWECSYCPFSIICPHKKINTTKRGR